MPKKIKPAFGCITHGRYRGPRPPDATKSGCNECWAAYGRWRLYKDEQAKVVSTGRARGRGQSSKGKGRSGVEAVRDLLLRVAHWLEPDDFLVKATSQIGVDLHLSPAASKWFPYAIESKNVETLNIWKALKQADEQAKKVSKPAIVFFKRANTRLYVALSAEEFLKLLPTWPKNQHPHQHQTLTGPEAETPVPTPSSSF